MLALASSAPLSLVVQRAMPATARLATPRMAEFVETDAAVLDRYMNLPHPGQVQAEYLWIDAKARRAPREERRPAPCPPTTLSRRPRRRLPGFAARRPAEK